MMTTPYSAQETRVMTGVYLVDGARFFLCNGITGCGALVHPDYWLAHRRRDCR